MDLPFSEALRTVLSLVPEHTPIARIDRLWIFPPKELGTREAGLLVVSLLPTADALPEQRQVCTIRYQCGRSGGDPLVFVTEEGAAPADRIPRVIGGVVARLGEGEDPAEVTVGGDAEAWAELMARAATHVDPANRE